MKLSNLEMFRMWQAGKPNGLTQRKLAEYLGMEFNALHGKIWRFQEAHSQAGGSTLNKVYPQVELKSAVFDIETTNFTAGGVNAHMICMCVLPLDRDEVTTVSLDFSDQRDDRRVLLDAMEVLSEYDILIGHNIQAFDTGWLGTRLAYHGLNAPAKRWLAYDTYQAAKRMALKADRKSLAFLCDFFQLEYIKTSVLPVSWSMIDSPKEEEFQKAHKDITYHCLEDVKANRKLFNCLWPLDRTMTALPIAKRL